MTYINRIFGSVEAIAENEIKEGDIILKKWEDYIDTIPEKKKIIAKLPYAFDERSAPLRRLKQLLTLEIVDIQVTKKEENDMIKNIESLEHSKRMKRIKRLEACLGYVESHDKYIYYLLCHLYVILKSEWHLLEKLEKNKDIRKYRKLVGLLTSELTMERKVLNQMYDVDEFHDIFVALVKREKVIKSMDAKEKRLLRLMQKRMDKISSGEISTGITLAWGKAVFNAVKVKVKEAYDKRILTQHPQIDTRFVNGPEFVDLVRETIQNLRKREVSEQMINVFVHVFREWFNSKLD
ncbi:hypothetical protein CMO89_01640 [Candidatus Woesearchaeota archaeon]|jgi:hypothetical protein|nr:hypothetical protein [Candidatus Woesearchaeota archaeon]|tara:strand:- start:1785 stop:2666 length:882 start_codon:yes stop_codon:yes gene_type:complete